MVNRRGSDAAPPPTPIAPVVKRKRRASCLGEQERRERKRAIDREAQRSLREKTKTHIAELERTIQILRDQDKNGATASLLSEIEALRAENERLRDVIDSVKNVVGSEIFPRSAAPANPASGGGGNSPGMTNGDQHSPKPRTNSMSRLSSTDSKPALPTPVEHLSNPFDFHQHVLNTSGMVDLDGMTVMTNMSVHSASATDPNLGMNIDLDPVKEIPEEEEGSLLDVPDSPETAAFAPYMSEIFGANWRCPSPVILHIGNPNADSLSSSVSSATNNALCPIWKRSNELFGKVFSYRAPAVSISTGTGTHYYHHNNYSFQASTAAAATALEAGILFLGIKQGWDLTSGWKQSPALSILKSVDEFLFCHLPKMERLAVAYKSFKLLKYYLNDTKEELERVPKWLRPSIAQTRTNHPVAIDFFAWPTLRDRLVQNHQEIFQTQDLSRCYSHFLHFDWPFAFEDSFFYDEAEQAYFPCPIFERYHEDLRYWTVGEEFYSDFPEMREDIEGDRARFMVDVV